MEHFLETWGYLAVFVLSFISSMGLPVGAEVAIIYGGVLASGQIPSEPSPPEPGRRHRGGHPGRGAGLAGRLPHRLLRRAGPRRPGRKVRAAHPQGPRPGRGLVRPPGRAVRPVRPVHPAAALLRLLRRRAGRDGHGQVPASSPSSAAPSGAPPCAAWVLPGIQLQPRAARPSATPATWPPSWWSSPWSSCSSTGSGWCAPNGPPPP